MITLCCHHHYLFDAESIDVMRCDRWFLIACYLTQRVLLWFGVIADLYLWILLVEIILLQMQRAHWCFTMIELCFHHHFIFGAMSIVVIRSDSWFIIINYLVHSVLLWFGVITDLCLWIFLVEIILLWLHCEL